MSKESIYTRLKAAGCEIDNHESDLYVLATPEARRLTAGEPNRSYFTDPKGRLWIDLPFKYDPWWARRAGRRR